MTVKQLREGVSKFVTPKYPKVQRTDEQAAAKAAMAAEQLAHFQNRYNALKPDEDRRLLRDSIDYWMRRYQGYAVEATIGAHYRTSQALAQNSTYFEHVLPLCRGRDMLIGNILTPEQTLNIPTCFVTKEQDRTMAKAGLTSHSNDYWLFFSRYECLNDVITTCDGRVIDPKTWTLADHYKHFKIKV